MLKTYEYEFHPGRALGKPPTAECRWDEGFSLISNEPAPSEWYGQRERVLETSSKTQKIFTSSGLRSFIKTNSSPTSLAGGSGKLIGTSSGLSNTSKGLSEAAKGSRVATAAASATPLAAVAVVGAVAAGFYGVVNMIKYARNEKPGKQAAKDTVKGSAGAGVSAGLGIAAANAVAGSSLALGSTVIVPMAAGVAAAYVGIIVWHKLFFKEKMPSKSK